jgi:hypothetical protein
LKEQLNFLQLAILLPQQMSIQWNCLWSVVVAVVVARTRFQTAQVVAVVVA